MKCVYACIDSIKLGMYCTFSFHYYYYYFGKNCTSTSHQPRSFFIQEQIISLSHCDVHHHQHRTNQQCHQDVQTHACSSCSSQNMTIHLLETQQTHQLRRSKQWNQNHFSSNPWEKKKKSNPSNDQTQEIELINPSTKQMQIKPIKTTRNRSTHPPSKRKSNPLKQPIHHRGNPIFAGVGLGCLPQLFVGIEPM